MGAFIFCVIVIGILMMFMCEDFVSWLAATFLFSMVALAVCGIAGAFDEPKANTPQQAPLTQSDAPPEQTNNSQEVNQAAPTPKEEPKADPHKWPREMPDGVDAQKVWWQDWTNAVLKDETTIGCKDGVQVVVFGSANASGTTEWAGGYVRVHQDGKPYSCSESKDPSEEISK